MKISDLKIPYVAVAAMSLIALAHVPYGYYTFLRICVCACAGFTAYLKFKAGRMDILLWLCVAVAILFNPILTIHLPRDTWAILNIACAGLFSYLAFQATRGRG